MTHGAINSFPNPNAKKASQRILARMDSNARARALREPNSILDELLLTNAAYRGVVIRSRYAEDALRGDNQGCTPVCPDRLCIPKTLSGCDTAQESFKLAG
jgi:hypothetical protein